MKLHLPKKLLRAVMALMVSHTAITIAWAENTQQSVAEYKVTSHVTYGANGEKWIGITPDWQYQDNVYVLNNGANTLFTSDDDKQYSVTFDGANGAIQNTAIVGPSITVEKLKEIELTNFEENLICSEILTIQNNAEVAVHHNVVNREKQDEGCIYSKDVIIDNNEKVSISDNRVLSGAFDADGNVVKDADGNVVNPGSQINGGILACNSSAMAEYGKNSLTISSNKEVDISKNKAVSTGGSINGGVIFTEGPLNLENNGDVSFAENIAENQYGNVSGGAINVKYHTRFENRDLTGLSIANNSGTVKFQDNYAIAGESAEGGAIYNAGGEEGIFDKNANLIFSGNKAESVDGYVGGGAIYSETKLSFTNNENIQFDKNSISTGSGTAMGGAIFVGESGLSFSNNGNILFDKNTVSGGGVYVMGSAIFDGFGGLNINKNKGTITVSNNETMSKSSLSFGAVVSFATITVSENAGVITFSGNKINRVGTNNWSGVAGGGAVGSLNALLINKNKSDIVFSDNSVTSGTRVCGGAILNFIGDVTFSGNEGAIQFVNNTISGTSGARGGAIAAYTELAENLGVEYSGEKSSVVFENNGAVLFSGNKILSGPLNLGGAIYSSNEVILSENAGVSFVDNGSATSYHAAGGAIFSKGNIAIEDNTGDVLFKGNTIDAKQFADGGALYSYYGQDGNILINRNNGDVAFIGNRVSSETQDASGGAIYCRQDIQITENKNVSFKGNSVITNDDAAQGGAISCGGNLTISDNADILFDNNTISSVGGEGMASAIALDGVLTINDNKGTITVSNNGATTYGSYYGNDGNHYYGGYATLGAVFAASTQIVGNTGTVTFSGNYIKDRVGPQNNPFDFKGYSDRIITGDPSVNGIAGGAALVSLNGTNISNNGSDIKFSGNSIDAVNRIVLGGALANAMGDAKIADNTGTVEFSNNTAKASGTGCDVRGGAIATLGDLVGQIDPEMGAVESSVKLQGNGGVLFSGNTATSLSGEAKGGGIYSSNDVIISDNKGDVSFSGNGVSGAKAVGGAIFASRDLSIVNNDGYVTFRGNYVKAGESYKLNSIYVESGKVELAAADGMSMTFYDAVVVGEGDAIVLNSFTDTQGNLQTSRGDIIFSGATTVADLTAAKGGVAGTAEEIAASRTSIIARNVSVAAGSLVVIDGAQLEMLSLTVNEKATLVLGAGSGITTQNVTFIEGSHLMVQAVAEASTLTLDEAAAQSAVLDADTISLTGGMICDFDGAYLDLSRVNNLYLDPSNGEAITFCFGEEATIEKDGKLYFVVFSGYKGLDDAIISGGWYTHNLDNHGLQDVEMGYHADTGTLYFSATAPIPEPTTATLSLLALAALAARRRRK